MRRLSVMSAIVAMVFVGFTQSGCNAAQGQAVEELGIGFALVLSNRN